MAAGPVVAPTRRERLRAATVAGIVQVARAHVARDGAQALSLRAVARDVGMSAPALYRYFDSHEALLEAVVADVYHELSDALESARDTDPAARVGDRMLRVCREFRHWALGHRAEFALAFAAPLPGFAAPPEGPAEEACARFGRVFADLFARLWVGHRFPVPEVGEPRLRAQLETFRAHLGADLPLGALQLFVQCWTRLFGHVALETFGHLSFALVDAEPLFEEMLADFTRQLGLEGLYSAP